MPQHTPHTPRRSRHSRTARRDAESPVAMGTVAALSGHHRCRSTQQPRCGSQRCAAFRGFVVPVPPPPARHAGGKTSAHTMHQQPGQLDAGRQAHSLAYMPVPLIDGPDSISRHAVHSQHSSQQSSAVTSFVTFAASGNVCSRHVHALRARPGHSQWRLRPYYPGPTPRACTVRDSACFTRCP